MRSNPIARMGAPAPAVLSVAGPDGYISPDWYGLQDQVPTWNYVAAHLDGSAELVAETDLHRILEIQAADYEGATGGDWAVADAPADFVDGLARAIAGFRFAATGFLAIRKLSQNRNDTDRAAVTDWLGRTRPESGDISWWMAEAGQG